MCECVCGRKKMVPPARFQRATFRLGGGRSMQLSYGSMNKAGSKRVAKMYPPLYPSSNDYARSLKAVRRFRGKLLINETSSHPLMPMYSLPLQSSTKKVPLDNHFAWWRYVPGANWRRPSGPSSIIEGWKNIRWSTSPLKMLSISTQRISVSCD